MIVFPNCKINLGLHILQRRRDGYHDLETIFYPVALHDSLEIIQGTASSNVEISTSGIYIENSSSDNICAKAYQLLRTDFPDLPSISLHLHKNIPIGAGLGGGSADGAFTLVLLNKKFDLGLTQKQLLDYALQLGSDCPFFIINKPCFANGRGENIEIINVDLSSYTIILVNPGLHISTASAFSKIQPYSERTSLKELIQQPVNHWKNILKNDFEESTFREYPQLLNIKESLYNQGAIYASMSGSGSTFYGIFLKDSAPEFTFPAHYFITSF